MASKHPSTSSRVIRTCGSACSRPTAQPSALARTGNKLMLRLRWNLYAARRIRHRGRAPHSTSKTKQPSSKASAEHLSQRFYREMLKAINQGTLLGRNCSEAGIHTSLASARQPSCRVQVSDLCAWMAGQEGVERPRCRILTRLERSSNYVRYGADYKRSVVFGHSYRSGDWAG